MPTLNELFEEIEKEKDAEPRPAPLTPEELARKYPPLEDDLRHSDDYADEDADDLDDDDEEEEDC